MSPRTTTGRRAETLEGLGLGAALGLLVESLDLPTVISWWGDQSWLIPAGALLGVVLAAVGRRRLLLVPLVPLLVAWCGVALLPISSGLAEGLVRDEAPVSADAVFPLASGLQPDGDLSVGSMARLVRALEVAAQGYAPRLIVSEQPAPSPRAEPAIRRLARGLGVDVELIVVGPIWNTRDEALAAARLAEERGWERLILVTSPLHTLRASRTFEAAGVRVTTVAAPEPRYDLEGMARMGDRLSAFAPVLHERLGLIWYRRRGWIP